MDFLPVIILYLEVLLLAFAERRLWNTWFTPLNCLSVPYALVLAVCLCVDGNMGFVPFHYPSVWVWIAGLAVFFVPSCLLGLRQRKKHIGKSTESKEFTVSPCTRRILEYITWGILALFAFWFIRLTFIKNLIPGGEIFAQEWAGHGFFGHLFTVFMGLNIFWLFAADKNHKLYWIYVLGFFGVALLYLVKCWFLIPMAGGLILRLIAGKTKFSIKVILISVFTGFAFFFASYWMTMYVASAEKGVDKQRKKQTEYKTEVSSYIGKHAVTYITAGVYGLSEDLAQNTLEYRDAAVIYSPFINICKVFGNKDYISNINDQYVQITTHDSGSNVRSFFGSLYVYLGWGHFLAYVLAFACLVYLLFAFALNHRNIALFLILGWIQGCLSMGWFDLYSTSLNFISIPCFLLTIFGFCHLWRNRKEFHRFRRPVLRKTRRFLALFQTISFSLILLLFGLPSHASYVFLGISAGTAFVFLLTVPRKAISFRFFKQSVSFLLIYLLLWISVSYATYPVHAAVYSFKQISIFLVPFVFWGMTPRFFSPKRLRLFACCFLTGCLLLLVAKTAQLVYCFDILWPYLKLYYIDAGVTYLGSGYLKVLNEFISSQGVYLSWACLEPVMHTITEALVLNIAFTLLFTARIQRHPFLDSRFKKFVADILLSCFAVFLITSSSKTGQFLFAVNILLLIVSAFRQNRKKLAYGISGVLLVACMVGFYFFGMGILGRFSNSIQVIENLHEKKELVNDRSLLPRIYCWQTGLKMVKERPVLGFGASFRKDFKTHFATDHPGYPRDYSHPHNQFLIALLSNGIPGLLVFLLFWFQAVRLVWKSHRLWGWIWLAGLFLLCSIDTIFYQLARLYFCLPYCLLMAEYHNLQKSASPIKELQNNPRYS